MRYLLVISLLAYGVSISGQEAKLLTAEANEAYKKERYVKADSLYSEALALDTSYIPARYNKALVLYRMNEFEKASSEFQLLSSSKIDSIASNSEFNKANSELKIWFKEDVQLNLISEELKGTKMNENDDVEVKMAKFLLKDSLLTRQRELIKSKEARLNEVIEGYKNCLRINPNDDDARYNLIYARMLLPVKEEPEKKDDQNEENQDQKEEKENEFAIKTYQEVLKLIDTNDFKGAYKKLDQGIKQDPALNRHSQLLEKLKIINSILDK